MRTRAQALLSGEAEVAAAARPPSQRLLDRIKLKISNGRYGTRSQVLKEQQSRDVKIVLKRKAAAPPPQEAALVIKSHKRGIQSQRRGRHERDKGDEVEEEQHDKEEEDEEEMKEVEKQEEQEEMKEELEEDGDEEIREERQQRSRKAESSALPPKVKVGKARSRRPTPATENASPSRDPASNRGEEQEQEGRKGGEETKLGAKTKVAGEVCTVNTDMVADRSEASISSDPSCSFDSRKRDEDGQALVATRTPLFVPAKRSPLPLPLPAPAPAVAAPPPSAAPPAVRSALPAPPAVRSALPFPYEDAAAATTDDEKVGMDEVDIHGFSSAVTGPDIQFRMRHDGLTERSSDEDGVSLPEEEMLSTMFFGSPWHDDGSINGLPELRKRGGPGSRATYRCSRCLAPKKGHRCPFETDSPAEEQPKPDQLPTRHSSKKPSDTTTSNELQHRNAGGASPSKSNELSNHEEETSGRTAKVKTAAAAAAADQVVKEFSVSAKWLLESGVLEGLTVRYMPRAGEVLGTGVVKSGVILCSCRQCKGHQGFNASSFEKHVGSTARHPSDFIFLDNGRRLREVLEDGSRFRDKPNMMSALRRAVSMDWDAS